MMRTSSCSPSVVAGARVTEGTARLLVPRSARPAAPMRLVPRARRASSSPRAAATARGALRAWSLPPRSSRSRLRAVSSPTRMRQSQRVVAGTIALPAVLPLRQVPRVGRARDAAWTPRRAPALVPDRRRADSSAAARGTRVTVAVPRRRVAVPLPSTWRLQSLPMALPDRQPVMELLPRGVVATVAAAGVEAAAMAEPPEGPQVAARRHRRGSRPQGLRTLRASRPADLPFDTLAHCGCGAVFRHTMP